jgi:hypothetical protein
MNVNVLFHCFSDYLEAMIRRRYHQRDREADDEFELPAFREAAGQNNEGRQGARRGGNFEKHCQGCG